MNSIDLELNLQACHSTNIDLWAVTSSLKYYRSDTVQLVLAIHFTWLTQHSLHVKILR